MLLSRLPYLVWPALPSSFTAQTIALLHQFEETQWWPAERLVERQFSQLAALLTHFNRTSSFLRPRLRSFDRAFGSKLNPDTLREIPPLTRAEIRAAGESLFNATLPHGHQELRTSDSSGSSGPPVRIRKTEVNQIFHEALNLRNHLWHERDFAASFASIRRYPHGAAMPPDGGRGDTWAVGFRTGPAFSFNSAFSTLGQQIEWLERVRPAYLFSYPSLLHALARRCERDGVRMPWLKGFMSFGEVTAPAQREGVKRVFGTCIRDTYSASEVSKIAIQCPAVEEHYHVQSESLLVEIVDRDGRPCGIGEPGRVLITDLHNFVTPMLRYEIGDVAEWGARCPCGRGLPVIRRIVGRTLNLLRLPDGETLIPDIERQEFDALAPVRQVQVVQRSFTAMEVRLAVDRPLEADELARVRQAVLHGLHDRPFELSFAFVDEIPRSQAGKYEAFICALDPPDGEPVN